MKLTSLLTTTLSLLILISSHLAKSQTKDIDNNTKLSIDNFIVKQMNETGIVGIGAAIIVDKKVVWSDGYGYADKENRIPFTPSTLMNIASITKTFTGVCIMKAVENLLTFGQNL